jgi:hypothetical protein
MASRYKSKKIINMLLSWFVLKIRSIGFIYFIFKKMEVSWKQNLTICSYRQKMCFFFKGIITLAT